MASKDWPGHATTLYRALKLQNGKVVVLDWDHLHATCVVARTPEQFYILIGQGWLSGTPQEAMDAFEAEEQRIGNEAAYRAADDQSMSEAAKKESDDYEKTVPLAHVPVIPEQVKKPRGRPKKVQA